MSEKMELPKGWSLSSISEIAEINPKIPNRECISTEYEVQFLPMKLVEEITNRIHLTETRKYADVLKGSYTPFIDGDIVFAKVTPCMENGKVAIVDNLKNGIGFGSSEFHVIRARKQVLPEYIFNFLVREKFRNNAAKAMTGAVGLRRVPKQFIENHPIPLPPLAEQHRIVAKIEELFSSLDKGIESLKTAQAQLKTYRQAVLKWAFEGKLTNENVKDGELPEGWKWEKIGNHIDMQSGVAFKKSEYSKIGVRLFQIANVSFNYTKWEEVEYLPSDYIVKYPDLLLKNGDIVMALNRPMLNNHLKIAEIKTNDIPAILYQRVGRFIFNDKIQSKYYLFYLQSPVFIKWLNEQLQGVNIPFINKNNLMGYSHFPLPTLPEQSLIVAEIEKRLSVCDKLEESISNSLQQTEALRQSILKKAFEGKLVPQDPSDEPASVLLEKINTERALRQAKGSKAVVSKKVTTARKRRGV